MSEHKWAKGEKKLMTGLSAQPTLGLDTHNANLPVWLIGVSRTTKKRAPSGHHEAPYASKSGLGIE